MREIKIRYFASLKDCTQKTSEVLSTASTCPQELYNELQGRYGFTLAAHELRVAINDQFVEMNTVLTTGDEVVFIPPVSGG